MSGTFRKGHELTDALYALLVELDEAENNGAAADAHEKIGILIAENRITILSQLEPL